VSDHDQTTPAYLINDQPVVEPLELLDVQRLIDATTDRWYNQTLCQLGGIVVRLGVLQGEFHWHKHDQQDEFFLVLDGTLDLELDGMDTVRLGPRQGYIVPRGLLHRPVVPVRTAVLMLEQAGVVATGD
jgi:mannose-6-phosphate isomerase-like protein (cupin superfamily)